jgi:hypothetical protein
MAGTGDDGTPHARGRRGRRDSLPSHHHDAHAPSAYQPTLSLQLLRQRERNDHASSQSLHTSTIAEGLQLPRQRERDDVERKVSISCSQRNNVTLVDSMRMLNLHDRIEKINHHTSITNAPTTTKQPASSQPPHTTNQPASSQPPHVTNTADEYACV